MSIFYRAPGIACDWPECDAYAESQGFSTKQLRRKLSEQGWWRDRRDDICPKHKRPE